MSDNPYASAARKVATVGAEQRAAATVMARDTTPEQSAEVISLATRSGLTPAVVREDPKQVRADLERRDLDQLARDNPLAGEWASAPDNYAVARDDLGTLGRLVQAITNPVPEIARWLVTTKPQQVVDVARAAGAAVPDTVGATLSGAGHLFDAVGRRGARGLESLFGLEANMVPLEQQIGSPSDALRAAGARFKEAGDSLGVPAERQTIATDVAGAVGQLGTQVVQAVVAPPTLVPSLLSQGADQMAARVAEAGKEGTVDGDSAIIGGAALTGLLERYGVGQILNRLPPAIRNNAMRRLADIAVAGGVEATQEVVEGVAQDLMTRALLDEDYAIGEGLSREAIAAGGAGAILRTIVNGVAGRRGRHQAQAERQHVDALVELAQESKTRERAPEALAELVERASPGQQVYVPLDALQGYYGTRTAAAVATLTGDPNAYTEATETGIEVAIPLSRYVALITADGHRAIADRMRMQPGEDIKPGDIGPTREEIEADIVQGLAEARAAEAPPVDAMESPTARPLIDDPQMMGATTYAEYQQAVQAAQLAREQARNVERERQQQRARDRLQRRERVQVQAEVEAELRTHPVYRAQDIMRGKALPDGAESPSLVKLDHAAVLATYGEDVAARLKGLTRKRGGLNPDEAAAVLGYESGAKLVHDLTTAPAFADMVRVETDARMQATEPDSDPDPTQGDDGTDAQADVMLREIQALEARNGGVRTQGHVLREIARRLIANKEVTKLQPHLYRQAEAKAAREAYHAAAKQDWRAAAAARRRQLQNLYLYREARNARDEATKAGRYLAQFDRKATRAKLGKAGADYLEQVEAILDRFDFRSLSNTQTRTRQSLGDWVKAKAEQGVVIDLPPMIADEAYRAPFRSLKVGELRELRDAVRHIVHMANEANVLRLGDAAHDRMQIDEAMAQAVRAGNKARPPRAADPTLGEKARRELMQARALMATATDTARELDGFKDGGAVWEHTVRVVRAANTTTNRELQKATETMAALKLQHYSKAELRTMDRATIYVPETGDTWSKGRILSLALNWGNADNREAILTQAVARLEPQQVGALFRELDARDWKYVQGVWDMIDGYWPAIAEAQRRRTGLVPGKVERASFGVRTKDGQDLVIAGGYFPLKYAADSVKQQRIEEAETFDRIRTGAYSKAATRHGHTIERVGSGGKTVRLDSGVAAQHLRDVIRDLHLGDAVAYVHQALHGQAFAEAVRDTSNVELVHGMDIWLRDVASGEMGLRRLDERMLRALRSNFTASVLTWKATSAALQVTGVLQSSVVLGKGPMLDGVLRFLKHPVASTRYVSEASEDMRQRLTTHIEAVQRVMDAEAGTFSATMASMVRHGYWMMGRVQATVDVATWLAAEQVGLEKFGGDVTRARAYADDIVSRAQGSGDFINKNAIQRGTLSDSMRQSEWIRATTTLQGYMITKFNASYAATKTADFRSLGGALKWTSDMMTLFIWEGLVGAVIRGAWPSDEEDDGSTVDDWLMKAGAEGASSLLGGIPGLSQAVSELRGYDAKGVVSDAWESVGRAVQQVGQGEVDKALVKSHVTLAGFLLGIPSSQINKTIDAIDKANRGDEVSPYEYLVGPSKEKKD